MDNETRHGGSAALGATPPVGGRVFDNGLDSHQAYPPAVTAGVRADVRLGLLSPSGLFVHPIFTLLVGHHHQLEQRLDVEVAEALSLKVKAGVCLGVRHGDVQRDNGLLQFDLQSAALDLIIGTSVSRPPKSL
jgi:hypothetical protein